MTRLVSKTKKYLRCLWWAGLQFVRGPFVYRSSPGLRDFFSQIDALRFEAQAKLPKISPGDLFGQSGAAELRIFGPPPGLLLRWHDSRIALLSPNELIFMCALVRQLRPRSIFEFGTGCGGSSYHFYLNSPPGTALVTLGKDIWASGQPEVEEFLQSDKIRVLRGDSKEFKFSELDRKFDLIFIDGGHSYTAVQHDTKLALQMIAPGGTIVWHDYSSSSPGVRKYLDELGADLPLHQISGTALAIYQPAQALGQDQRGEHERAA